MKKLILLLLCAVSSFSLAATQASDGSNLRDSIFRIYRSMPADTARTQFLKDIFVHNIEAKAQGRCAPPECQRRSMPETFLPRN